MRREPLLFDLTVTAFGMLAHSRRHGIPACPKCGTASKKAYLGRSVLSIELDLWPRAGGAIRGFGVKLRCRSCGARAVVRSEAAPTGDQQFAGFRVVLASLGDAQEVALPPAGPANGPEAGAGGIASGGSEPDAAPAGKVVPSRRGDPQAPGISADELVEVVLAIRAAKTWRQVLEIIGCG